MHFPCRNNLTFTKFQLIFHFAFVLVILRVKNHKKFFLLWDGKNDDHGVLNITSCLNQNYCFIGGNFITTKIFKRVSRFLWKTRKIFLVIRRMKIKLKANLMFGVLLGSEATICRVCILYKELFNLYVERL